MDKYCIYANTILIGKELTPFYNGSVLVKDGKIEKICPREMCTKEGMEDYIFIDLKDATLMPGMIECHNHVALDARLENHLEMMQCSECELSILSLKNLKDDLFSGVTTARCMGDRYYIDVVFKKEIEKGTVIGPNLLVSGIGMRSLHGHGYVGMPHCGVEPLRKTARENMARGVDFLKIFVTAGAPPVKGGFIPHFLSFDEIKAVVEEGERMGIKTAAHCIGGQGLRDCIAAGVEVIEHAYCATEQDAELIEQSGRWVDLTSGIFMDETREVFCSAKSVKQVRAYREQVIKNLENIGKSNVKLALGTDAYHSYLYKEVEYAVALGVSRKRALMGITSAAAQMSGIGDKTGRIEEGFDGDIIGVLKNPLDTPKALKMVSFVMKNGVVYKRDCL